MDEGQNLHALNKVPWGGTMYPALDGAGAWNIEGGLSHLYTRMLFEHCNTVHSPYTFSRQNEVNHQEESLNKPHTESAKRAGKF